MSKKLIYFATLKEASASIDRLQATPIAAGRGCYRYDQGVVVIGGMGIYATIAAVSSHLNDVDEIWNLGVAADLHARFKLGDCLPIHSVQVAAFYPKGLEERSQRMHRMLYPPITLQQLGARLITTDYPIHQAELRDQLAQQADLVDMEGYGIAYLAKHVAKRCVIWKVISDFATIGGPELIHQQLEQASERLAEIVTA